MNKINEIFYSLQGEGFFSGTPSIFIRFSGCNLRCPFCDTQHESGEMLSIEEIMARIETFPASHVVLTGGEPALFVTSLLISRLHDAGKFVSIETNGTHILPQGIDWITLSPKFDVCQAAEVLLSSCDELKVVFQNQDMMPYEQIQAKYRFLQPCDYGEARKNEENLKQTTDYVLAHPSWRLSLQIHKVINIK